MAKRLGGGEGGGGGMRQQVLEFGLFICWVPTLGIELPGSVQLPVLD
jgi:hypothetical protein